MFEAVKEAEWLRQLQMCELRHHFLRDKVNNVNTVLQYKCSKDMTADFLTTPVTKEEL